MLTPEQLILDAKSVGSPQISPDGSAIVYTLGYVERDTLASRNDLWMMSVDGGDNRQVTWNYQRVSSPVWSPDGSRIAFSAWNGRDNTIRVLDRDGGESRPLVSHINPPMALAWSPDGNRIAYTLKVDPENPSGASRPSGAPAPVRAVSRLDYKQDNRGYLNNARHQLHAVNVSTGQTKQLSSAYKDHDFPQWSPDGSRIAVRVSDANGMHNVVQLFPATGGEPKEFGWDEGVVGVYSWSPDGSQIIFSGYPTNSPQHEFWRYITATGEIVPSTDGMDFSPESGFPTISGPAQPVWIDDDKVLINAGIQGMTSLFGLDVTDGVDVQITIWQSNHSGLSIDDAHTTIVQVADSTDSPGRLVKVNLKTHEVTTLLDPNEDLLPPASLPSVEQITVERGEERIDAWVYLPPDMDESQKYPVILDIHGGPHGHHGFTWNRGAHLMAAAGNIVIAPNPRGSGTYGREYAEKVWGDWGGEDWLDILAVLDSVLERGYADAKRCGIFGYSYGGFMTSWAIGHTDRFKAAVVGAPVYNFTSFYGTSDIGHVWCDTQWGESVLDPATAPAILEHSPHTHIHNAVTPTLILHGEADDRCPIGQGEELFVALKKHGVETEFVRYPGGSHLMLRQGPPAHRIDFYDRIIEWFGKRL